MKKIKQTNIFTAESTAAVHDVSQTREKLPAIIDDALKKIVVGDGIMRTLYNPRIRTPAHEFESLVQIKYSRRPEIERAAAALIICYVLDCFSCVSLENEYRAAWQAAQISDLESGS